MTDCTDPADLVEASIDLVATQYRESPRLLALMRAYGVQVAEAFQALCRLPGAFDIDTAVGDQLTIVGKWLGWPRVHPQGARTAVFGFESADCDPCNTINGPVVGGFCYADWAGCAGSEFAPYVFVDDELYRRFLKARVVQLFGDYRRETLTNAIRALFGAPSAMIVTEAPGSIVVSLGRPFEPGERQILHLYRQVLPVAPGVGISIQAVGEVGRVFGFCDGWGGFCDDFFNGQWF